jgi:hypothetical protein
MGNENRQLRNPPTPSSMPSTAETWRNWSCQISITSWKKNAGSGKKTQFFFFQSIKIA